MPYVTLGDIIEPRSHSVMQGVEQWAFLTPKTSFFWRFFSAIGSLSDPVEIVEALYASGGTAEVLDSLPEAVLIPLREAIVNCQSQPPVTWGANLLSLVDREDVNMLQFPDLQRGITSSSILVS